MPLQRTLPLAGCSTNDGSSTARTGPSVEAATAHTAQDTAIGTPGGHSPSNPDLSQNARQNADLEPRRGRSPGQRHPLVTTDRAPRAVRETPSRLGRACRIRRRSRPRTWCRGSRRGSADLATLRCSPGWAGLEPSSLGAGRTVGLPDHLVDIAAFPFDQLHVEAAPCDLLAFDPHHNDSSHVEG